MTVEITEITAPASLADPGAEAYLAFADVINAAVLHDLRLDHLRVEPEEMLPGWHDQRYRIQRGFLARDPQGRAVGALDISGPREDEASELEFELAVLPAERGRGIEQRLLRVLEDEARNMDRTTLQTYSVHRLDTADEPLDSPTGYGRIPYDESARLYREAGFTLAQVERNSALDLTGDLAPVRDMLERALAVAGADYRIVTFSPPTPADLRESFAHVLSRMSTDVPAAGMTITEETWDAERVAARDARIAASGRTVSVAAVVHIPSGKVVAYNDLGIGTDRTRPTAQWGTLVVREHRGHRLGTIVKCANILRWRELVPESPFISTFNAEENRPMLDVNEAIGFVPLTVAGAWQKEIVTS